MQLNKEEIEEAFRKYFDECFNETHSFDESIFDYDKSIFENSKLISECDITETTLEDLFK